MVTAIRPLTLRELYDLAPPTRLTAPHTALVLVDFQLEFLSGGLVVDGGPAAVERASALLVWARTNNIFVVHVRNISVRANSPVFAPGSSTSELTPRLAPRANEIVVVKHQAGAFSGTDLHESLRWRGIDTLVVAGIMTHLAVDVSARDAAILGYRVLVAADACATRALPSATGTAVISAAEVHRAALAALADRFADVGDTDDILALPVDVA